MMQRKHMAQAREDKLTLVPCDYTAREHREKIN
jgi:hypothetical protein